MYHGWQKGFINLCVEITIWLGSFLLALFLSQYLIAFLGEFGLNRIWVRPAFFVVLLICFSRLIFVLCDRLSASVPDDIHLLWSNKLAGLLPGMVSGAIYASLLCFFLLSYSLGVVTERTKQSQIAGLLTSESELPGKSISNVLTTIGYRLGSSLTIYPKGQEVVSLPFKTSTFRVRNDLELQMLNYINDERRKADLPSLSFDEEMARVARKHSEDMIRRGYFSHYTIEGKGPYDRMRSAGVTFKTAGENLALAQTLRLAHEGLMESPIHKANILNERFGRVGIGILDAGVHGLIVTQDFRN